jgi:hypothetical protein
MLWFIFGIMAGICFIEWVVDYQYKEDMKDPDWNNDGWGN